MKNSSSEFSMESMLLIKDEGEKNEKL